MTAHAKHARASVSEVSELQLTRNRCELEGSDYYRENKMWLPVPNLTGD